MDEKVAAASRTFIKQAAEAFALLGGLATLFYVSGFVYSVSYFAGIGATWLASESRVLHTVPGAAMSLAVLLTITIAFASFRVPVLAPRPVLVGIGVFSVVLSFFPAVIDPSTVTLAQHASLFTLAEIVAAGAGFAAFQLSISYLLEKGVRARVRGVLSVVALIGVVFLLVPAHHGRAISLADLADPSNRLPVAVIRTAGTVTRLPVLLTTSDRVFCLDNRHAGTPLLRPTFWADIESLSTRDSR